MLELLTKIPQNENDLLNFSLDELAKMGAKVILTQALQLEVSEYIEKNKSIKNPVGHQMVVRNGSGKERKITVGSGTIKIKAPRINDKRKDENFYSSIVPRYLKKSANVESILPLLYLKGLSGNSFREALTELLGKDAAGLSSSSISILKKSWEKEFINWKKRPINKQFIYLWADGVNISVRLGEDKKLCLLVVIGVDEDGKKELLAVESGFRESTNSWKAVFTSLVGRGLKSPLLMIGDGGLGLWSAMKEIEEFKDTKEQRCWVHKIANVLDKLPKKIQPKAKEILHEIMKSETKTDAEEALKVFKNTYKNKYPKSYECLNKNWSQLTSFYNFPGAVIRYTTWANFYYIQLTNFFIINF